MSGKTNPAASIRARLLNQSREQKVDFQRILINYGLERLLYRLSVSPYRDEFVLKGAMLFSCWSGDVYRATKDVDFLKSGEATIEYLERVFTDLCAQAVEPDDGLLFDAKSIKAAEIREEDHYGGIRVTLKATLSNAEIPIQADIGIGDVITPEAESIEFPTLLDMPVPILKAYPVETVIAEKFEAMVSLGFANSRMKDFYDIWAIQKFIPPDSKILAEAIENTFNRRGTSLPTEVPLALTDAFSRDETKQKQWKAFVKRAGVAHHATDTLHETVDEIRPFLMASVKR
ncbi:MAG TPA: nucleotidyl transferase AbiEii/AbiGii toxin family protein [Mariprofundaceae bacterium]|nr:nucleotidyl transferase AbiEii/AbiGii toxin family protein [Mariprofundaceae bacterium]